MATYMSESEAIAERQENEVISHGYQNIDGKLTKVYKVIPCPTWLNDAAADRANNADAWSY